MHQDIAPLRTELNEFLQSRHTIHDHYPPELKKSILEYAGSQRSEKVSLRATASELGLSLSTLNGWLYARQPKPKLKPVIVSSEVPSTESSVVLITSSGHRVEGLDINGMAQLLRGLS